MASTDHLLGIGFRSLLFDDFFLVFFDRHDYGSDHSDQGETRGHQPIRHHAPKAVDQHRCNGSKCEPGRDDEGHRD